MQWISQYCDLAIETVANDRPVEMDLNLDPAMDLRTRPRQHLGGLLGRNIRSAKVPAAGDVQRDFKPKAIRFAQCVAIKRNPRRAAEFGSRGDIMVAILV